MQTAKLVLITGGLGPTKDDLTKASICDFFDSKLVLNEDVLVHVEDFFLKRGRSLTESNRLQAIVPDNCEVVINKQGTAPAMHFVKDDTHFVFMPGVPFEMKGIMTDWVIPYFTANCALKAKAQRTVLTSGMGESFLADRIAHWEDALPQNTKLAYLPSPGRVRLRISVEADQQEMANAQLQKQINLLQEIIPELIYGFDEDTLEEVIGKLLIANKLTVATAESCTGGLIAHRLSSVAGSSAYFKGSVVAYANEAKSKVLGIDAELITNHGAVSEEVAKAMAQKVRQLMDTDLAVSTTGIAGPDGGSEEKPVGTIWIAMATKEGVVAEKFQFGNQRDRNNTWALQTALNMIRRYLLTKIS
jgi:nicotinamide-nucleotide amidase